MNKLKMTNNYSVYIHTNKTNGKKYVGITKQKPERRWQKGFGYVGSVFGVAINKYGWDGFTHDIVACELSKNEACKLEISLISKYKTRDNRYGYNVSKGGDIPDNLKPLYGLEHPNHKRVKMIDAKTGKIIKVFNSQSEAAEQMEFSRKPITKACRGQLATYKGYIWEYADIDFEKPVHNGYGNYKHDKIQIAVIMTDKDGEHYFDSVQEAARYIGVKPCTVSRHLTGARTDTKRGWSYAS